ncbi:16S rRNA (guanine(527)-N(7))-methyltransferase [hydrothermal vent metagenome]|uniref:16S rRNA (Guanine(527)-N(7))-methyltransferase n=1 Tax=hydrothermal vent metagenome TaxID=652676 RepID=A0A3B0QP57_9ZZZZ
MKLKNQQIEEYLKEGAAELGIERNTAQIAQYGTYIAELKKWSKRMNLTSLTGDKDIIVRHFLDSLIPLPYMNGIETLLDIGTGAGFPGLVLKIARPELRLTLLEPTGKKTHFLRHVVRTLGLEGVDIINGRAEDPAIIEKKAHTFDCVTSRALSELSVFFEMARPYLKEGGRIVAMKGPLDGKLDAELDKVAGTRPVVEEVCIPFSDRKTSIVVFYPSF